MPIKQNQQPKRLLKQNQQPRLKQRKHRSDQ
jgi:hypothetical protein